ncbi:MAG: apolipoprotein N-acyltransferase [Elusimicrobia bacterium]|nr:apolipoprotein N-acyltransferase [Elusimicrobiota bacterium]
MSRGGFAQLGAAGLGGALLALGLPPLGLWAFAWFGLVPLISAANEAPAARRAALCGFAAGLAYHVVALHWIYETCRFAQMPVAVSALAVAGLAALLGASWAMVAALVHRLSGAVPRPARPWLWALCWTAVASASSRWTPRFGVDLLGYTQWSNLSLIQAGSWGGPHLLDFVILFFNAALAEIRLAAKNDRELFWGVNRLVRGGARGEKSSTVGANSEMGPAVAGLAVALALTAGVWTHGARVLAGRSERRGPAGRVEILQPCVDQYHKWDAGWIAEIMAGYDELLSRPRAASPLLVVWPETAIPRWARRTEAAPEIARWAIKLRAPHLVGIIASADGEGGPSNAAQLIAPDGRVDGRYAKRQLVPFGEFVPLRRFVPRFVVDRWLQILDNLGDLEAGPARQPLPRTAWGPTALTICYEVIFPRWPRLDAARGARLLINITNDAWYRDTWGPRQHYRVNRFRAIENRLSVVRAGNNGVSAVIDPWGVTTAELALNERGRLDAEVPLEDAFPARSFYARHGDWFGAACLAVVLIALLRRRFV